MTRVWTATAWAAVGGIALLVMGACAAAQEANAATAEGSWQELFNGRDLTGWTPKIRGYPLGENYADTFRVTNSVLQVAYDKYDGPFRERFGHLFHARSFSNYMLRIEYRFVGEQVPGGPTWAVRNSGVMLHGQTPDSMLLDQSFPVSVEVQFLGGDGLHSRTTANLCTPGTHVFMNGRLHTAHCTDSRSKTYHGDQWVTVEIEVRGGDLIRHRIDDQTVLEYTEPRLDENDPDARRLIRAGAATRLDRGTISLQSESHPIEFRRVAVKEL
jgi:hypothetical protein